MDKPTQARIRFQPLFNARGQFSVKALFTQPLQPLEEFDMPVVTVFTQKGGLTVHQGGIHDMYI